MTPLQIVTNLNNRAINPVFVSFFTATLKSDDPNLSEYPPNRILIKSKRPAESIKFYVANSGAEQVLRFNRMAGVSEMPAYFERHTVGNIPNFPDGVGLLIKLDEADNLDKLVIESAVSAKNQSLGYAVANTRDDYELLGGRSGIFTFTKTTLNSDDLPEVTIQYPAGAKVGDLAKKTFYSYDGAYHTPVETVEVPYVLTVSDLITPP
jgi:hypothetical protein